MSTYPYAEHDEGIVLTQPRPGEFERRPMSAAELAARDPALSIARDIYRHANQAGVCYIEIWSLIADAIQKGIESARPEEGPIAEITAERRRQVEKEGWDDEHDDGHPLGNLALAGACYAANAAGFAEVCDVAGSCLWPWAPEWWKPKNPRRDLVRARALIVAELERMDREAAPSDMNKDRAP